MVVFTFCPDDAGSQSPVLCGLCGGAGREHFHDMDGTDAEAREVQGFVEPAVPAADHEHVFVLVGGAVADRAVVDLFERRFHRQRDGFRPVAMITTSAVKLSPSEVRISLGWPSSRTSSTSLTSSMATPRDSTCSRQGGHEIHAVDALV